MRKIKLIASLASAILLGSCSLDFFDLSDWPSDLSSISFNNNAEDVARVSDSLRAAEDSINNYFTSQYITAYSQEWDQTSSSYSTPSNNYFAFYQTTLSDYLIQVEQSVYIFNMIASSFYSLAATGNFEFGRLYSGSAYMRTINDLNNALINYGVDSPTFYFKANYNDNVVTIDCDWDYRSSFLHDNASWWDMCILSGAKLYLNSETNAPEVLSLHYNFLNDWNLCFAVTKFYFIDMSFQHVQIANNINAPGHIYDDSFRPTTPLQKLWNEGTLDYSELLFANSVNLAHVISADSNGVSAYSYYRDNVNCSDPSDYSVPGAARSFVDLYEPVYANIHDTTLRTTELNKGTCYDIGTIFKECADYSLIRSTVVILADNSCVPLYVTYDELSFALRDSIEGTEPIEELVTFVSEVQNYMDNNYVHPNGGNIFQDYSELNIYADNVDNFSGMEIVKKSTDFEIHYYLSYSSQTIFLTKDSNGLIGHGLVNI